QKAQELAKHRVVTFGGFGAGKQYLAVRPDGVVDFVSLAKPQGATHSFRHSGLVAVGQRGFNIENGRHGVLRSKGCMHWMVMQSPCHINAVALSVVVGGHRGRNAVRTAGRLSVESWAFCVLGL